MSAHELNMVKTPHLQNLSETNNRSMSKLITGIFPLEQMFVWQPSMHTPSRVQTHTHTHTHTHTYTHTRWVPQMYVQTTNNRPQSPFTADYLTGLAHLRFNFHLHQNPPPHTHTDTHTHTHTQAHTGTHTGSVSPLHLAVQPTVNKKSIVHLLFLLVAEPKWRR